MTFIVSFDERSLAQIAQFYSLDILRSPEIQAAMQAGGELLAETAQAITWQVFDHPSGQLALTIHPIVDSPYEIQIGSDDPKARRREKGFLGLVDSLGRVGTDRARPYMAPALDQKQQEVLRLIDAAVELRLQRLAGG